MATRSPGFKECYIHRGRPAVRDCARCGRPICKQCGVESGDPSLCPPCAEAGIKEQSELREVLKPDKTPPVGARQASVLAGEVTILGDGTVVEPEVEEPPEPGPEPPPAPAPDEPTGAPDEPTGPSKPGHRAPEPAAGKTGVGLSPGPVSPAPPAPPLETSAGALEGRAEEMAQAARAARAAASGPTAEKARPAAKPPAKRRPVPAGKKQEPGREKALAREARTEAKQKASAERKGRRRERRLSRTGTLYQVLYATPYAAGAGLVVMGIWILIAYGTRQWTQASAFTLGLAVPWVYYRSSILKKQYGRRVWNRPPAPVWVALPSALIVAAIIPLMELLAYEAIYRSNSFLPFSDFAQRYLRTVDWLLVVGGVLLAFLAPFLLKMAESWKSFRLRKGEEKGKEKAGVSEDKKASSASSDNG